MPIETFWMLVMDLRVPIWFSTLVEQGYQAYQYSIKLLSDFFCVHVVSNMIKRVPHDLRWAILDNIHYKSHQMLAGMIDTLFSFELMITQQPNVFSLAFKLPWPWQWRRAISVVVASAGVVLKVVTHIHEKEVFIFPCIFLSVL